MFYILICIVSYILGAIPSAFLLVRLVTGKNIMDYGTGNVGTMNTHRATNNKLLTLVVLFCDALKGYLSWFLAVYLVANQGLNSVYAVALAGFFAILGHNYSVFLKFKGGKGLAIGFGFFLGLNPILDVVWIISFFVVTGISRYMVLGQMLASIGIMLYVIIVSDKQALAVLLMGALVCIKHLPRMKNVLNGTEPKMYYKVREKQATKAE